LCEKATYSGEFSLIYREYAGRCLPLQRREKIIEHWNVVQQVPESMDTGNDMFS
jgi:hypothetical protein